MSTYRCDSCGTEFEASSTSPTIKLACGGVEVTCTRIGVSPEAAERARIRREFKGELRRLDVENLGEEDATSDSGALYSRKEILAALDRICPEEP